MSALNSLIDRKMAGAFDHLTVRHQSSLLRFADWVDFTRTHGRQPGNARLVSAQEARLYEWMRVLRRARNRGELDPAVQTSFDDIAPEWIEARSVGRPRWVPTEDGEGRQVPRPHVLTANVATHKPRAAAYAEFIALHNHRPFSTAEDSAELSMARWFAKKRTQLIEGKLHPAVRAAISDELPGWDSTSGMLAFEIAATSDFHERLGQLEAYINEHDGQRPPRNRMPETPGYWLAEQKDLFRMGNLDHTRKRALDNVLSRGWHRPQADIDWSTALDSLVTFVSTNGHFPRRAAESDRSELKLEQWLRRQRAHLRTGDLSRQRSDALRRAVPGWDEPKLMATWTRSLHEVVEFYAAHRQLPRATAGHPYNWLAYQRSRHKAGLLSEAQVAMIDAAAPGWRPDDLTEP
ncbi:helicase associated domain-containing protein [Plantibacter flavus]|nr:helicase associated domain-containing protein [Plantibacter flavus]